MRSSKRARHPFVLVAGLLLATPTGIAFGQDASPTERLVADLGADDVNKRDEAQKKLEALGKKALPALEKAEKESKDAEVRARAHEAILSIRKARGETPDAKPEKDEEREGPQLPPERRFAPRGGMPRLPQGGEDQELNELFKMFEGGGDMKALSKIFEQLQKQMRGMDEEFQKELKRPRNGPNMNRPNMRVFQFGARPKTPAEEKLGVTLDAPPPALQAQLELSPTDGGLIVDELTANGPAWKAGLKLYDIVLKIDGNAVRSPADLKGLGEKDAKVEVIRKAKRETIVVHGAPADDAEPKADEKPEKRDEKKEDAPIRKF